MNLENLLNRLLLFKDLIAKAQKFRIKRNLCLYDPTGFVGEKDTEAIYVTAIRFWKKVKAHLDDNHPQLNLFDDQFCT